MLVAEVRFQLIDGEEFSSRYSLSSSLVVFSVTLGRGTSSFVLTCCRPLLGMGLLTAGGNALRTGIDPTACC